MRMKDENETPVVSNPSDGRSARALVSGGRGRSSIAGLSRAAFEGGVGGLKSCTNRPHIASRPTPAPGLTLASL
jgi:hypothetical protein